MASRRLDRDRVRCGEGRTGARSLGMVRIAGSVLLAAALSGCGGSGGDRGPLPATPHSQDDICAIFAQYPEWHDVTHEVERRRGAPVAVQMAIMWRESNFRAAARPPGRVSSAYGYSQAIDGTWEWYREDTGRDGADRTDFADAADFVGWYISKTVSMNGVSIWDTYNQYLAYHEGHTGFRRGSYNAKPWLITVAGRVAEQAIVYHAQLRDCR